MKLREFILDIWYQLTTRPEEPDPWYLDGSPRSPWPTEPMPWRHVALGVAVYGGAVAVALGALGAGVYALLS